MTRQARSMATRAAPDLIRGTGQYLKPLLGRASRASAAGELDLVAAK